MSSAEINLLNERFGIAEQLRFTRGEGGLTFIEVLTEQAGARIALQGAQLIHWAPAGEAPVIWLSPQARYARGSSLRGGVPVCWPWFGPHGTQADYPAHGFARTAPWDVMATRLDDDGRIGIRLQLPVRAMRDDIWPHAARLELAITVGTALEMELQTCNAGDETIVIGEALHTYFQVSDIRKVAISGLEDCEYQDKVGEGGSRHQSGRIRFTQETDRVYLHTTADCCIHDPGLKRQISPTVIGVDLSLFGIGHGVIKRSGWKL